MTNTREEMLLDTFVTLFDTLVEEGLVKDSTPVLEPGGHYTIPGRTLVLFKHAG